MNIEDWKNATYPACIGLSQVGFWRRRELWTDLSIKRWPLHLRFLPSSWVFYDRTGAKFSPPWRKVWKRLWLLCLRHWLSLDVRHWVTLLEQTLLLDIVTTTLASVAASHGSDCPIESSMLCTKQPRTRRAVRQHTAETWLRCMGQIGKPNF